MRIIQTIIVYKIISNLKDNQRKLEEKQLEANNKQKKLEERIRQLELNNNQQKQKLEEKIKYLESFIKDINVFQE